MNIYQIFTETLMLVAVLNPFGNVPLFVGMTEKMEKETRKKLFKTIAVTGFFIMWLFSLVGEFLMTNFYKIDMKELKMAEGMILVVMAFRNLIFSIGKQDAQQDEISPEDQIKRAVIPMSFPMMVGPGSLTTVLILKAEKGIIMTSFSILIAFILIYLTFILGNYLEKIVGTLVLYILSRVMQIFIMSIGIRIFFSGLMGILQAHMVL